MVFSSFLFPETVAAFFSTERQSYLPLRVLFLLVLTPTKRIRPVDSGLFYPTGLYSLPDIINSYMDNVTAWATFGAGIASFITPRVLPMVPVYLASLAGLVFTATGALAGLAGISINPNSPAVHRISGGLLIFFGLFMLGAGFIPWLNFEKRLPPKASTGTGYVRSFLVGAAFTVAWTPCLSPILGSVLTLAVNSATTGRGAFLLAVYSLGMGLPFLLIGAFFSTLMPLLKRIGPASHWIYFASGVLLAIAGILILLGKFNFLYLNN